MQQRQAMLEARELGLTVGEVCALFAVSRTTFFYWQRRYDREGDVGLENRSTRPKHSPNRMDPLLESQIVELRSAHRRWGPKRIRAELARRGRPVPARSTIEAVLRRNGLLGTKPAKKPEPVRFVRERANELWQIDAFETELASGRVVQIISVLDDHSRYLATASAFESLSIEAAIASFETAVADVGLPESVLADRGAIFTGRSFGTVNAFEHHLWSQGVYTINGRPYHPQTQGKIERYHRTLGEWLEDRGPYASMRALRRSLHAFRADYNHDRPHQAIGDRTPAEVFAAAVKAAPDAITAAQRCRRETTRTVSSLGQITYGDWQVGLGRIWAGGVVRVVDYGSVIEVRTAGGELIRDAKPDYTTRYLASGSPRGRPRKFNNV